MPPKDKTRNQLSSKHTSEQKNDYALGVVPEFWLSADNVSAGVNTIPPQDNLVIIEIWNDPDHGIIVKDKTSQQIPDGLDAQGDTRYRDEHRSKFDGKTFPLRLLVPYNLSGDHFEIAAIKLSDRQTATSVVIYNNSSDKSYKKLKNILVRKLQITQLPEEPRKVFKCRDETQLIAEDQVISCRDGRCGDAVIAIARLKARRVAATYENLAGEPYNLDTAGLSHTQIFDELRKKHSAEGLCENPELLISEESDAESQIDEFKTPEKQITRSEPTTPYEYDDIHKRISSARTLGREKFRTSILGSKKESHLSKFIKTGSIPPSTKKKKGTENFRQRSGTVPSSVIEVDENGKIKPRTLTHKPNGYDENFRLEDVNLYAKWDKDFGLDDSPANFKKGFAYSRFPTNGYTHFRGDDGSTTFHTGGGVNENAVPKNSTDTARRELSEKAIKKLKSTNGSKTKGSLGEDSFHEGRQGVINNVVNAVKTLRATIEKKKKRKNKPTETELENLANLQKQSPVTATVEALKFVINDTVGYKDNTPENRRKFKGITTDGLNLEDETQREYALKHYQGARDVAKLGVLKHSGALSEVDSTSESSRLEDDGLPEKIKRINHKLQHIRLEEKYHGKVPDDKRNLSPLRYASPYSRSVIDIALTEFESAKTYTEIATVYATPIPVIRPTEELVVAEETKRKLPTDPGPARNIIAPSRSRVRSEPAKTNKPLDLDKESSFRQPNFDEPESPAKLPPKSIQTKQITPVNNSKREK